jgi:adenylate cyclase
MRLSVSKKLNTLLISMLVLGIGGAVWLATQLFSTDLVGHIKRELLDSVAVLSSRSRSEFGALLEKANLLGALSLEEFEYPEDRLKFLMDNLQGDPRIVSMALIESNEAGLKESWRIFNKESLAEVPLTYPKDPTLFKLDTAQGMNFESQQVTPELSIYRSFLPLVKNKDGKVIRWICLDLDQSKTFAAVSDYVNTTAVLLGAQGVVLASGDALKFPVAQKLPLFNEMEKDSSIIRQFEYRDASKAPYLAAYQSVGVGGLMILGITPLERVTLAQNKLLRRAALLGAFFLFLALAMGISFAGTLTKPLEALGAAAERITLGDFSIRLKMPKKWSGNFFKPDEIKQVTTVFNDMVSGLEERERMKNLIEKFHSKEIAKKLMTGNFQLGGERKEAAVAFVDIRSFTELSETYSPEECVAILNRYMTKMVSVITRNQGVVDKYIGDAIMALWGVPEKSDGDMKNALQACVEMRAAMDELNAELEAANLPRIKVGIGLHYGPLIAGNIGSSSRMEYTAVGDTVNTASRIQDLTKLHKTDLLVSEAFAQQFATQYRFEAVGESQVRGKKESMRLYKIVAGANLSAGDQAA